MSAITSRAVTETSGATYGQIDRWTTAGLLSAGNTGSGNPRHFTAADVAVATVLAPLSRLVHIEQIPELLRTVAGAVRRGETSVSIAGIRIDWTEVSK